jgi:glycosyltransferase involved in cell wall biosynthesis
LTTIYRAIGDVWITAISHHQASTATRVPIRAVVHHGIDLDQVPVGNGRGGYASFLGRMSPDKGAREAALVARAAGVPLLMAAKMREPEEHDYFQAQVKPLLGQGIEYVGELSFGEKVELLGTSFALLNPVQWPEPFGLVMVEALAAGTPVVGTPCGSAPEIVDHGVTGYLRPDLPGLSQALIDAADIDRHACRATVVRRFTTAHMVAGYEDLYRRAVRRHDSSRETAHAP